MNNIYKFTIGGILIELVAFLSFIFVARTIADSPGKQVIIIVGLVILTAFLFVAVKRLSIRDLAFLSVLLTIGLVCIHQILGFYFFPGIVKDIEPLSWEHFSKTVIETIIVFCGYMIGIVLILALKKIFKI